jgi:hypothetical protein
MPHHLTDRDRLTVRDTLAEIRAAPPPRNHAGLGCVMALPGFVILLVFPVVARKFGMGGGLATPVLVVGGLLLVVGLVLWFTAGGLVRGHAIAAAEAALRTLEAGDEDGDVLLRASTLLLTHAYATHGPATAQTFDFQDARRRLGARLDLVLAVEALLVAEDAIYPVFTLAQSSGGADTER